MIILAHVFCLFLAPQDFIFKITQCEGISKKQIEREIMKKE